MSGAVIQALVAACHAHPQQRVGQVISNALQQQSKSTIFYLSDDELARALWIYAGKAPA